MKNKILFLMFLMFFLIRPVFALDESEILLENSDENLKPVILEPQERPQEEISPYSKEALRAIIQKDYDLNSSQGMFHDQLEAKFSKGFVESSVFHTHLITTFSETIDEKDSDFLYDTSLLNVGVSGKFKGKKESYNFLFDLTPGIYEDFSHRFLLDASIETKRIPHHSVLFGASRPQLGYEGGQSVKTVPFLVRSQSARNFSNIRKTGIKVRGNYKWAEYEAGGFSSDTRFHEFMPGVEGNFWLDLKPLANVEEKYGKLYVGGGISGGTRNSKDFSVASSAIRYNREKFWMLAEYQYADGSNGGSGITENKAYGYNFTLAYRLTKKLEFLLRYDDFDSNKSIKNNNSKEYSAGINWFILGQCARIMLNYVYCDNDNKADSHRIILGTQLVL